MITRSSAHGITSTIGKKIVKKLDLENKITEAAYKGLSSIMVPIDDNFSKEDACSVAMYLQDLDYIIQDCRDEKGGYILIAWY